MVSNSSQHISQPAKNNVMKIKELTEKELDDSVWLTNFIDIYQQLSVDNLHLIKIIYHPEVTFIDPMHEINGINNLSEYFTSLYENLTECRFTIENVIENKDQAAVYWHMAYQHPKLNKGKSINVSGHSHIKGKDSLVVYHRDYIDLGEMVYEHIPILGALTKWVKKRAAK